MRYAKKGNLLLAVHIIREVLMTPRKHFVYLTAEQRYLLLQLISTGTASAHQLTHARIILKADRNQPDPPWTDKQIAQALEVSWDTVVRTIRRFVERGLDDALNGRPAHITRERILDGKQEAHLIALACGPAPAGRERWSLRLLANKMVE